MCGIELNDQTILATTSTDKTVRLWDPANGQHLNTLQGHTSAVWGVCGIELNGQTILATTSHDKTVRLWNASTGAATAVLHVSEAAYNVSFVGTTLVAALATGVLAVKVQ